MERKSEIDDAESVPLLEMRSLIASLLPVRAGASNVHSAIASSRTQSQGSQIYAILSLCFRLQQWGVYRPHYAMAHFRPHSFDSLRNWPRSIIQPVSPCSSSYQLG